MRKLFILICMVMVALPVGCSGPRSSTGITAEDESETDQAQRVETLLKNDPAGPVPAPSLPPALAAAASAQTPEAAPAGEGIAYTVECVAEDAPELVAAFTENSMLYRLMDTHPQNLTGLEQRLSVSLQEGRDILRAYGYYAGSIQGRVDAAPNAAPGDQGASSPAKAVVYVTFTPGPQYLMGVSKVIVDAPPVPAEKAPQAPAKPTASAKTSTPSPSPGSAQQPPAGIKLPTSLADTGLPVGAPAVTPQVLAAVNRVRDDFRNNGYPFAAIGSTRYVVDHETHQLEAEVHITPGPFVRMGDIDTPTAPGVRRAYLEALRPWEPGVPWNQDIVEDFRNRLRQSGLFQSIELAPADADDASGRRAVVTNLVGAPERTVGGSVKYDSDFGPGVQGYWEHRNLTGRGDSLRLELPIWADMQEFTGKYRLPFFYRPDQNFIAQFGAINQNTDAYELQSGAFAAGIERFVTPQWTIGAQASAEGGTIKDPQEPRHAYMMFGLPLRVAYNNTGSILDSTRGLRAQVAAAPYTGTYNNEFSILRARFDAQGFIPLVGEDKLVLALRGAYGTVTGAKADEIPPSVRFYGGGGGSVRGYAYQSLGPRNDKNDPLGGVSLVEFGLEPRWKITETWGLVAFLDGGTVYEQSTPELGQEIFWGAGLGFRYYTVIGPLRFDVATPLNPRKDDDSVQFYISIGQSF